jgi:hypothetical protein
VVRGVDAAQKSAKDNEAVPSSATKAKTPFANGNGTQANTESLASDEATDGANAEAPTADPSASNSSPSPTSPENPS